MINIKRLLNLFGALAAMLFLLSATQLVDVQALLGDVDISGTVDDDDLAIIDSAYGTSSYTNPLPLNWDESADINLDRYVNLEDLALAGRSYADTFNFHVHRRVSNGYNDTPTLTNPQWTDAAVDSHGNVHVIWEENRTSNDYLFYSQLDASGNALIEDVMISNDSINSRIAIGPDDSAHIVYRGSSGIYYAHINPDGSFFSSSVKIPYTYNFSWNPVVAVDEYNHAHIAYSNNYEQIFYTIIGDNYCQWLTATQINVTSTESAASMAVAVSSDGARHILWHQFTETRAGGELHYTRISKDGVVTVNDRTVAVLEGMYNHRSYYLASDSHDAVHFLYYDFRDGKPGVYWRRANADGTLTSEVLITNNVISSAGTGVSYAIDAFDNIHLVVSWINAGGQFGYAKLDRNGNFLTAFQRGLFNGETYHAVITVNSSGQAMIVAPADSGSPAALFISSTVPDPAAYDPNRADLVLDKAHLTITDYILKINESAHITLTITNGGAAPAENVVVRFSYPDLGDTVSFIDVPVDDLPAFTRLEINQFIEVPDFEEVDTWGVTISVSTSTAETSIHNNTVIAPFGVFPPPRMFNLEVRTFDETYSPDDQANAEPLPGAILSLECAEGIIHSQTIDPTVNFNIFWDIPLDTRSFNAPLYSTTCNVTLSKEGFSTDSTIVTAQRSSQAYPYTILLSEDRPIKLYINTWGSIAGTITNEGREGVENALIKLDSGQQTHTDKEGNYLFEKIPAGKQTLQIWVAGFLPIQGEPVAVAQGKTTSLNLIMEETKRADVFGVVSNEYGQARSGALVEFFGGGSLIDAIITNDSGSFAFSIDPYEEGTAYRLDTTLDFYYPVSTSLTGLVPGLPLRENITLEYDAASGDEMSTDGSIKSWVQDERWCKSYDDDEDLPLRVKILQFIGSNWCPSFQTVVNWGAFDYELGLNYFADETGKTAHELLIKFTNNEFMSYDVSSGGWHLGAETSSGTVERIDWVELIAIDSNGNPIGDYVWNDDQIRFSSTQDDPVNPEWRIQIDRLAPTWNTAAIRIFYTIGQYNESAENHFKTWHPPADLGMAGSGGPSGADRQVITWMLSANDSEMRYALTDYPSSLPIGMREPAATQQQDIQKQLPVDDINSYREIIVTAVSAGPARVGTPYAVDIRLNEFESRPVYALEFDLDFNQEYLRLIDFQEVPDFAGAYGSWHRNLDLAAINTAGILTNEAVVRLAAAAGLGEGRVVRLIFMPIKVTPTNTKLDLLNTRVADLEGTLFTPDHVTDLYVVVEKAKIYLPIMFR